jgi:hypothetical protein
MVHLASSQATIPCSISMWGVYGDSSQQGVFGHSVSGTGTGVFGNGSGGSLTDRIRKGERKMRTKSFAVAVSFALFVSSTLCAETDVTAGTWKLNAAESKYTPAAQARYETINIEAVGDNMDFKVILDGTDSAGQKVHAEWTGKYDGKDYPVTGSPDIDSLAYTKRDDRHYDSTNKRSGKVRGTAKIVYSADGKTRTVTSSGTNSKGKKVSATAVYDKQ